MKNSIKIILAVIVFLSYKANYFYYEFDGTKFKYKVWLTARWYSPTWILYVIFRLVVSISTTGIIDWFKEIREDLFDDGCSENRSWEGSFKNSTSWLRKRVLLFTFTYLGVI